MKSESEEEQEEEVEEVNEPEGGEEELVEDNVEENDSSSTTDSDEFSPVEVLILLVHSIDNCVSNLSIKVLSFYSIFSLIKFCGFD